MELHKDLDEKDLAQLIRQIYVILSNPLKVKKISIYQDSILTQLLNVADKVEEFYETSTN